MLFSIPRQEKIIQDLIQAHDKISRIAAFYHRVGKRDQCPKEIDWINVEFVANYLSNLVSKLTRIPWFVTTIIFTNDEMFSIYKFLDDDFNISDLYEKCDSYLTENYPS